MKRKIITLCLAALIATGAAAGIVPMLAGTKTDDSKDRINAIVLVNALAAENDSETQARLAAVDYTDAIIVNYGYEEGAEFGTAVITIADEYKDTYTDAQKTLVIIKPDANGEKADATDVPAASLIAIDQDAEITSVPMPVLNSKEDEGIYTVLMGGTEGKIYEGTFVIQQEQTASPSPTAQASETTAPAPTQTANPSTTPKPTEVTTPSPTAITTPEPSPSDTDPTATPAPQETAKPSDAPAETDLPSATETAAPQNDTYIELLNDTTALSNGALTGSVSAKIENAGKDAKLILAVYDEGGKLKNVQIKDASGEVVFAELNINGITNYTYSIFAWENLENQNPLCAPYDKK